MDQLEGTVQKVSFYNQDTFYTVAKLKDGAGRLVTVVGNLPPLYQGAKLLLKGQWVQHKEYGNQFQIAEWQNEIPRTLLGIERFLGSGLIKGIGPATAQKIVQRFGLETLEVIQATPAALAELPGISQAKAERIARGLAEHDEVQRIMVFLQGYGVTPALALKIFRRYHQEAIKVVTENPYRLADEVFGIGFKIADQIAQKMGFAPDSQYRIQAGIRYWLNENSGEGHVFALEPEFMAKTSQELQATELQVAAEIETLILKKDLFRELTPQGAALYLPPFYYSETGAAAKLRDLLQAGLQPVAVQAARLLAGFSVSTGLMLAERQQEAVLKAMQNGVLVITGGPGTGKTTIIKAVLHLLKAAQLQVLLAAPTGRAAKRLAESTQEPAKTIHRMLGYGNESGAGSRFQFDEEAPLPADVIIVDEFSMVDLLLFYHLLKAVVPGTRLIMVGDVDQLPSVGPGSVLRDLIQCGMIPTVRLNVIFRQAKQSLIVENAHKINSGQFPLLSTSQDFFFMADDNPEHIVQQLPDLLRNRIPGFVKCDPIEDIQVLTPMRRTITGVENLNLCLQAALNPPDPAKPELKAGQNIFRQGDKVMQLKNDYQKLVFNGDIGRIREVDAEERRLTVGFAEVEGERLVSYEAEELDQLVLSYAISVHKSQGNEYPVVVLPVTTQHYLMLQRNLLYTAVTRAKKMVLLIGTKKAVAIAIHNNRIEERHSMLCQRIREQLAVVSEQ